MKNHIIKIIANKNGKCGSEISADSMEELKAKLEKFLQVDQSIYWNSSAENALGSRVVQGIMEEEYHVEYAHSDYFYFEQIDNTEENAKLAQIAELEAEEAELQKKLSDSDFYVIRKAETGVDYDQAIKDERAAARVRISEIREEKAAL
jgi:phenylpropionate dioxygenase-like ring-hydroxylating dioxygenase large terminal subunit